MSDINTNPMDKLFKEKLGGREFDFDEAAWLDAETLIDGANSGSALSLWKFASISGGILGIALLFLLTCNPNDEKTTASNQPITIENTSAEPALIDISSPLSSTSSTTENQPTAIASLGLSQEELQIESQSAAYETPVNNRKVLPSGNGTNNEPTFMAGVAMQSDTYVNSNTAAEEQKDSETSNENNNDNEFTLGFTAQKEKRSNETQPKSNEAENESVGFTGEELAPAVAWKIETEAELLNTRFASLARAIDQEPKKAKSVALPKIPQPFYLEFNVFANQWKTNANGNREADTFRANSQAKLGYGADVSLMIPKGKFSFGGGIGFERLNSKICAPTYDEFASSIQDVQVLGTDSLWTPTSNTAGYYFTIFFLDTIQDTVTTVTNVEAACTEVQRTTAYASILGAYHYRKNRWMLSLSAGPTIRYLLEQRGSYPSATSEAYAVLENNAFRTINLGLLVRPSIHYQLSDVLSVGASLSYHSALLNSGDNDLLVNERLSSLGLGLSFRYFIH